MPFIKKSEMLKIKNYIYKCDEIESFRYHVDLSNSSDTFHIQNKNILKLADSLKYKNTLIDLEIDAKGTRLKEISIMLGKITIKSIKHFSLMCMDDVFKKNKDASRADGLINFMSNQKEMYDLRFELTFVEDVYLVNYICHAISRMTQIKDLYMTINNLDGDDQLDMEEFLREELNYRKRKNKPKIDDSGLDVLMSSLENLRDLDLYIKDFIVSEIHFMEILEAIALNKRLRKTSFSFPQKKLMEFSVKEIIRLFK